MDNKSSMNQDQLQRMRFQFLQLDVRGDGKIGLYQLGDCLRALGANPSEKSIRQHFQQLHDRQMDRISFDEFLSIYEQIQATAPQHQPEMDKQAAEFIDCLRFFDEKNTGYMSAARLCLLLSHSDDCLNKNELEELLADRVNSEGLVNYVELVRTIMRG